jgi:hypothetical protein
MERDRSHHQGAAPAGPTRLRRRPPRGRHHARRALPARNDRRISRLAVLHRTRAARLRRVVASPTARRRCPWPASRSRSGLRRPRPTRAIQIAPSASFGRLVCVRAGATQRHGPSSARRNSQIAHLTAEGLSNREIGERLYLSHRTIGTHPYNLFPKLGITSRAQLRDALGGPRICKPASGASGSRQTRRPLGRVSSPPLTRLPGLSHTGIRLRVPRCRFKHQAQRRPSEQADCSKSTRRVATVAYRVLSDLRVAIDG